MRSVAKISAVASSFDFRVSRPRFDSRRMLRTQFVFISFPFSFFFFFLTLVNRIKDFFSLFCSKF